MPRCTRDRLACTGERGVTRSIAGSDRRCADRRRDALSGAVAERRGAPRARRVSHRRTMGGDLTGAARVGDVARPPRRSPIRRPAPLWNGWGPTVENNHFQTAAQAGTHRRAGAAPDAEVGVRISGHDGGLGAADDRRRTPLRRQPERHRLLPRPKTGCVFWTFTAQGGVRASISIGRRARRGSARTARISPIRRASPTRSMPRPAKPLWRRKVDDHPLIRLTGSPALYDGRLYVPTSSYEESGKGPTYACCTFRGSVVALDAMTGNVCGAPTHRRNRRR